MVLSETNRNPWPFESAVTIVIGVVAVTAILAVFSTKLPRILRLSVGSHCPKNRINPVESREIEPLAPNKNISDDVPATAMNGLLWQPEQEFVSGPEIRLKFSGKPVGQRDL
jgi:hypothetical protein